MNSFTDQSQPPSEYQANLEILMQVPLFSGLPIEPIKLIAYLCKREHFKTGDVIFHQHEMDPNGYFIIRGETTLIDEETGEPYTTLKEQQFIGAMSLFCDIKRLFSLRCDSPATCLILSREKFRKVLERFPEIGMRLMESLLLGVYEWEERFLREHTSRSRDCRKWVGVSLT